jgi:alanine dehydrogenase
MLAGAGWKDAVARDAALAKGLTTHHGALLNVAVAQAHGYQVTDPAGLLVG